MSHRGRLQGPGHGRITSSNWVLALVRFLLQACSFLHNLKQFKKLLKYPAALFTLSPTCVNAFRPHLSDHFYPVDMFFLSTTFTKICRPPLPRHFFPLRECCFFTNFSVGQFGLPLLCMFSPLFFHHTIFSTHPKLADRFQNLHNGLRLASFFHKKICVIASLNLTYLHTYPLGLFLKIKLLVSRRTKFNTSAYLPIGFLFKIKITRSSFVCGRWGRPK